jgi:hypothetical protein
MADPAFNPGPQPDFPRMAQLQRDFAEECKKIPNIPQFTTGNDILEALRHLEGRIDDVGRELREKIDTVGREQQNR